MASSPFAAPGRRAYGSAGLVNDGSIFQGFNIALYFTTDHDEEIYMPRIGAATILNRGILGGQGGRLGGLGGGPAEAPGDFRWAREPGSHLLGHGPGRNRRGTGRRGHWRPLGPPGSPTPSI